MFLPMTVHHEHVDGVKDGIVSTHQASKPETKVTKYSQTFYIKYTQLMIKN